MLEKNGTQEQRSSLQLSHNMEAFLLWCVALANKPYGKNRAGGVICRPPGGAWRELFLLYLCKTFWPLIGRSPQNRAPHRWNNSLPTFPLPNRKNLLDYFRTKRCSKTWTLSINKEKRRTFSEHKLRRFFEPKLQRVSEQKLRPFSTLRRFPSKNFANPLFFFFFFSTSAAVTSRQAATSPISRSTSLSVLRARTWSPLVSKRRSRARRARLDSPARRDSLDIFSHTLTNARVEERGGEGDVSRVCTTIGVFTQKKKK